VTYSIKNYEKGKYNLNTDQGNEKKERKNSTISSEVRMVHELPSTKQVLSWVINLAGFKQPKDNV